MATAPFPRHHGPMERSITVDVAAPAEHVWQVLSDVGRWPGWTPSVTSVRQADEGPLRVGARVTLSQPRLPTSEYVVTELVPGRTFTWVATRPGVRTTARHDVAALDDGTRVRLSVTQSGWLGAAMGRIYRGLTDRYLAAEANGLRSRCEEHR